MKRARVIITTECNLKCKYCCNRMEDIQDSFKMTTVDQFIKMDYDVVNITGGEPTLAMGKMLRLVDTLKKYKDNLQIYLYTNGYHIDTDTMETLSEYIDGVNIGIHDNFDEVFRMVKRWKAFVPNTVVQIQDTKITDKIIKTTAMYNIKVKSWQLNDCNKTEEDRWII